MHIQYPEIIGKKYPEIIFHSFSNNYEDIVWENSEPIPRATLDLNIIEEMKQIKISELSINCQKIIVNGFESNALGAIHIYDSDPEDQINLIGASADTAPDDNNPNGKSMYYACRNPETMIKTYVLHTHQQLRQVISDGSNFKLYNLQHFHMKRMEIMAITELNISTLHELLEAIDW